MKSAPEIGAQYSEGKVKNIIVFLEGTVTNLAI